MSEPFILNAPVLVLNKHWQPVGETTVKKALVDMNGGHYGKRPSKLAMDIEMEFRSDGGWRLVIARPVEWEEWVTLPIREDHHQDRVLHSHRYAFRGPTVLICSVFDEIPVKQMRWSIGNVWERDKGECQVTGEKLTRSTGNVAHDKAIALGGRDEWGNTVLLRKDLNTLMGTKSFSEMGWKLRRKPAAPPALPVSATIKVARHVQWLPFLIK